MNGKRIILKTILAEDQIVGSLASFEQGRMPYKDQEIIEVLFRLDS
jgi:hypothetical protein